MILIGEESLRRAVGEFIEHSHHERNHQGLANQLIVPVATQTHRDGRILSRERLGGLLKYYHPRRVTANRQRFLAIAIRTLDCNIRSHVRRS